jgi:NTP pyrophosphatase (non-canonical NTP hydrolase)
VTPILSDEYLHLLARGKEQLVAEGLTLERQLLWLQAEVGEAANALMGAMGANPRKGFTHTATDVAEELADVAMTALLGIMLCGKNPEEFLSAQALKIAERMKEHEARRS